MEIEHMTPMTPEKGSVRRSWNLTEASLSEPTLQDRKKGRTSQGCINLCSMARHAPTDPEKISHGLAC
jgi:hypothetical protein